MQTAHQYLIIHYAITFLLFQNNFIWFFFLFWVIAFVTFWDSLVFYYIVYNTESPAPLSQVCSYPEVWFFGLFTCSFILLDICHAVRSRLMSPLNLMAVITLNEFHLPLSSSPSYFLMFCKDGHVWQDATHCCLHFTLGVLG